MNSIPDHNDPNSKIDEKEFIQIESKPLFEINFSFEYWKVILINSILVSSIFSIIIIGLLLFPLIPFILIKYFLILKNRKCYVTKNYIFLSQDSPIFLLPFLKNHLERTIPLQKITDITITQSWIERFFGLSVMKIETAGNSNSIQNGSVVTADLILSGIEESQCKKYKQMILDLVSNRNEIQNDLEGNDLILTSGSTFRTDLLNVLNDIRVSLKKIEDNKSFTTISELA